MYAIFGCMLCLNLAIRKYDYSSLSRVPRVSATRVSVAFHSWAATGPIPCQQ
ncbi:hypothetical protein B296_00005106 [Ensete ventricosum]|uniref:Uncharacterized protein n=1 Tax=Ensete ventricosum TaxID=4639 RepID=A0A426YY80_ENSVE|nr:hypothetical protein B296_00005106 [Ensete ventricosum]